MATESKCVTEEEIEGEKESTFLSSAVGGLLLLPLQELLVLGRNLSAVQPCGVGD